MTKTPIQYAQQIIVLLLLAFVFLITGELFLLFFVPVVAYVIWSLYDKNRELERRLHTLEKPGEKPEQ